MLTQRQLFLQHLAQTSDAPLALEIEKAEGVYLYDVAGKKYIDLIKYSDFISSFFFNCL